MGIPEYFSADWYTQLAEYVDSKHFTDVGYKIAGERKYKTIHPEKNSDLFLKVFKTVHYWQVKVVVLGQDPYHDGSYDGLAFSNDNNTVKCSPSLRNILKEVESDINDGFNINTVTNYSLYRWADQGVFLVNTAHTVVEGRPGSHLHYWKDFTKAMIEALDKRSDIVWLLWGAKAHEYESYITNTTHSIIKAGHPSPLNTSNPFKGCKCFSKCNKELEDKGLTPIKW